MANLVQKNKRNQWMIAGVVLVAILSMITYSFAAANLKWTGCGITKKAFMKEAAVAYEKKAGVKIKLSGGGATKGIRFANSGMADMGGNCRPALKDRFPAEEGEAHMTVVSWDALVPIVHPDNPVESITSDQLKKVMKGELTNWKELGGQDQKIQVMARVGKASPTSVPRTAGRACVAPAS